MVSGGTKLKCNNRETTYHHDNSMHLDVKEKCDGDCMGVKNSKIKEQTAYFQDLGFLFGMNQI